ncbi:P-loop containing nucleoside triphosphate hydrolase protein [Flagelloscypha sp. PMI_526]|nr:P-loop containing nucleoside triphosphate hydrolase protein [Flagelloscypha sp. PMI_526]
MSTAPTVSHKVQCCFLGPLGVGKTGLVIRLMAGEYTFWDPTIEDTYTCNVPHEDGTVVRLELDDWYSTEWESIDVCVRKCFREREPRPVALCFSLVDLRSFQAVIHEWHPAIMKWEPRVKFLLVGTKSDAEMPEADLDKLRLQHVGPIQREQCHALAREIGAHAYIECSAMEGHGIQELLDALVEVGKESTPQPPFKKIVPEGAPKGEYSVLCQCLYHLLGERKILDA